MLPNDYWRTIESDISSAISGPIHTGDARQIGANTYLVGGSGNRRFFLKIVLGEDAQVSVTAEFEGLKAIAATETVGCPHPVCTGRLNDLHAYLVTEWLDLGSPPPEPRLAWKELGRQLARMHRHTEPQGRFGFHVDGTIGESPQRNTWTTSWIEFFADHRLRFQESLEPGAYPKLEAVVDLLPRILAHDPSPSLVHGDLWTGNAGMTPKGGVIFDCSTHYGDREVDIAMSHLFGRLPAEFYIGYDEAWPLPSGHEGRRTLYNLYHVMNHFSMFGGGYGAQARRMMDDLIERWG